MISNLFISLQFYVWDDRDYVTIYDIKEDGNSIAIANLNGLDFKSFTVEGPEYHWKKKIVSSSSNRMLVEFKSDEASQEIGFSASIHYSALPSQKCEEGLDINMKTIQSPNYPDLYDNNMVCKWLISVPLGFHISLKFLHFDVRFFCNFQLCSTFPFF